MESNARAGAVRSHRSWFPWSGRHRTQHPSLAAMRDDRTLGERVADNVAAFGGSWPFIFLFLGMIAAWMVLNTVLLARVIHHKQFDPYPYIALNLMLSALAGLQAPIIMMSQNRAAAKDEALAAHHYEEGQKVEGIIMTNSALLGTLRQLLDANTELTRQVHQLSVEIREMLAPRAAPG
jgi:uncharacterized membrane protein